MIKSWYLSQHYQLLMIIMTCRVKWAKSPAYLKLPHCELEATCLILETYLTSLGLVKKLTLEFCGAFFYVFGTKDEPIYLSNQMSPFGVESQAQRKSRNACLDEIRVKLPSLPFQIYSSKKSNPWWISQDEQNR